MTKNVQPALATIFWSALMLQAEVLAAAGRCLWLLLAPAAGAETRASQPAPEGALAVRNTNVVAVYGGGSSTAGVVAECVGKPHFLADAEQNVRTIYLRPDRSTGSVRQCQCE